MDASAYSHMLVLAHYKMHSALSARGVYGNMVCDFFFFNLLVKNIIIVVFLFLAVVVVMVVEVRNVVEVVVMVVIGKHYFL